MSSSNSLKVVTYQCELMKVAELHTMTMLELTLESDAIQQGLVSILLFTRFSEGAKHHVGE